MPTTFVRRQSTLDQRRGEPARLVDTGGQDHHRALVEDDLQLEAQFADRLEHDVLHRLPTSDDAAANRQRMHATLAQPRDERLGRRLGEQGFAASAGLIKQRAVFGHNQIAAAQLRKCALQVRQLAAPGILESSERRNSVGVDDAVTRERAIIVRGKGQKIQRLLPSARWIPRPAAAPRYHGTSRHRR
jgi:hypothetical protein